MRIATSIVCLALLGAWWVTASSFAQKPPITVLPVVAAHATDAVRINYPEARLPQLVLPDGQKRAVHSLLNINKKMEFGDFVWNDNRIADGPIWVRVDLARQTISVFRAGNEIGSAVILFGADSKQTPAGVFPVLAKAREHRSSLYDAEMPFMLRLTGDGVAIHASNVRENSATHGCIGVPLEFARLLFAQVEVGDEVAIIAVE